MKKLIRTTIDSDVAAEASSLAEKGKISLSAIIERALDDYLPKLEKRIMTRQQDTRMQTPAS